MEPPTTGGRRRRALEKLKVLKALREPWSDTVERDVVLGQYAGYRDEPEVAKDSVTPTFAAMRVFVDNWRWQGVPFYLRTGKRLAKRVTEVSLHLRPVPLSLFGHGDVCERDRAQRAHRAHPARRGHRAVVLLQDPGARPAQSARSRWT